MQFKKIQARYLSKKKKKDTSYIQKQVEPSTFVCK